MLRQAQNILLPQGKPDSEGWGLVAALLVEADLAIAEARQDDETLQLPLLDEMIALLRDMTQDFTDRDFLRATRAARRQRPALFKSAKDPSRPA